MIGKTGEKCVVEVRRGVKKCVIEVRREKKKVRRRREKNALYR